MENEVSYRQVGREKGYVPPPRLKDEGVQRKGGGKRDAFGIRTERFSKPTNDVPPPGAYYRPSTMERDGRVCGSVSAKGFGSGFVSATPRFRDVKMLQEACLPGPGSYNAQPESGQEGGKLTSFSSLKRDCRLVPDQLTAAPGPGEYNIDRRDNPRIATGPTSSFRCTRTPLAVGTHLQTPAPGAYEILQGQHVQADKNGLILKDPFFRSQTKRSASFIASSDVPGPGEYDVDRGVATVKEACGTGAGGGGGGKGQGGVSAGRPGHQRCGHAREDEESSPGPGWYTPHQTKPQMRSSSSSSMFRSGTKRFSRSTVAGAPGPAFYQPEPLGKKSFRWNATKQWM